MEEIPISVFRAKCCEILERVRKTRRFVRVTRYGKPFVDVLPPTEKSVRTIAPREIPRTAGESAELQDDAARIKKRKTWTTKKKRSAGTPSSSSSSFTPP